jgi:hypothetical protein
LNSRQAKDFGHQQFGIETPISDAGFSEQSNRFAQQFSAIVLCDRTGHRKDSAGAGAELVRR